MQQLYLCRDKTFPVFKKGIAPYNKSDSDVTVYECGHLFNLLTE